MNTAALSAITVSSLPWLALPAATKTRLGTNILSSLC